ncbi:MAG: sugar transferase [Gammaproteobacteria bacterium]|nr:sugar transferase [Gammaproteobacteria bacterium]
MIRALDVLLSVICLVMGAPVFAVLWSLGWLETRSPIFRQVRLGRHRRPFVLLKFRTMRLETLNVPTHLISASSVTPLGRFMRRTKLDELPQLWNVLCGDMSLVGPRPGLPSQAALTEARMRAAVFEARPGVTGLAQLEGVDMSEPERLAEVDARMLSELTVAYYFRCIFKTAVGGGRGDRIRQ